MLRADLLYHANELLEALRPACQRIELAGSVRRGKPEVKDLEIVALPTLSDPPSDSLFGESTGEAEPAELACVLADLMDRGVLAWDEEVKRRGPKYKRLRFVDLPCAVDLFIADADNWGNTLAIRTGNAAFSKELMISARRRNLKQEGGYLRRIIVGPGEREIVSCPEEIDYFTALGVRWIEPGERTDDAAERLRRGELR